MTKMKENPKDAIFDEAKYKEAAELARTIEIGWTEFELFGLDYTLMTCPSKNDEGSQNGGPAEYCLCCQDKGIDIYLWEDVKEYIQRPMLFHEIVESYHRFYANIDYIPAHNATLPLEERFCNEFLSKEQMEEFLKFKKELGCNGFSLIKEATEEQTRS